MLIVTHVLLAATIAVADDPKTIPGDFRLFAQFYPGYSDWKPWKVTIEHDGKVTREVNGTTGGKLRLEESAVRDLVATVRKAEFFRLDESYEHSVTDQPTLLLRVTMDGETHEVSVYAYSSLKDRPEVRRFAGVWREVLRKVTAPNPEQTPDLYEP